MIRLFSLLLMLAAPLAAAHDDHSGSRGATETLGKVSFPTSCDPGVQAQFERGVALLHSFWFPEGLKAFKAVAEADPSCAMAYWGMAINRMLNPFNGEPAPAFVEEGRAAIEKAQALGAKTERERDYIAAAAVLYADVGTKPWRERAAAYEQAMSRLAETYPADVEAKVFHALALNFTADLNDQTYARPLRAARLLEPLLAAHPDHPGIAHYLIHSYDFPPLAEKGLAAARRYAAIAPSAAHALHMPSHIFTRVGAWEDSVATNQRSEEVARTGSSGDEALHAIDYQVYAFLQLARDEEASKALERGDDYGRRFASYRPPGPYALAAAPARYALERGDWKAAATLPVRPGKVLYATAVTHFARAIGAARSGDPRAARAEVERLTELRDRLGAAGNSYWSAQVDVQGMAAAAWTAFALGDREEALRLMRAAADSETRTEKASISPGPILPAQELLGDMLLEMGLPQQALQAYEASQRREPNRFRGWYGAATAAARANEAAKAESYYATLLALVRSDADRPELGIARTYLAGRSAR